MPLRARCAHTFASRNTWGILICAVLFASRAAPENPSTPKLPKLASPPPIADDGTITTPSFELPFSAYASEEAKNALVRRLRTPMPIPMSSDVNERRRSLDETFFGPQFQRARVLYPYSSKKSSIGGVPVETFEPASGTSPDNRKRVLINLHGGGFIVGGGGLGGAVESIPIASVGRIQVVSVDYRMAPEHHFPAATEDVVAVYRKLLETHKPEDVGIYGCSAGGMLTGETVARLLEEHLPLPGAIGIFCASTHRMGEGDSAYIGPRLGSTLPMIPPAKGEEAVDITPYFSGTSPTDPLVVPSADRKVLEAFPPTLFVTGTRAPEMSGAAQSHLELRELGVKSELLVFDGMDHGFIGDPDLPESKRAYHLIAQFFAENLGRPGPHR
jgi:acetyl esterase/lipase